MTPPPGQALPSPGPSGTRLSRLDRLVRRGFRLLFVRWREPAVASAWLLYCLGFVLSAPAIGVSANYLVILPVLATALAHGFKGGLVAGLVALPANLMLFALLGLLDAAPASWIMAELAGLAIGMSLGYLSDYFHRLDQELQHRLAVEAQLTKTLEEKVTLLGEVHHRVRNNLATIKSMVQLQLGTSEHHQVREASTALTRRIMALSLVHEQLYVSDSLSHLDAAAYLARLCHNIAEVWPPQELDLQLHSSGQGQAMSIENTVSLGLMVNEIIANSLRHARPAPQDGQAGPLRILVGFYQEGSTWKLTIRDNGQGMPAGPRHSGMGLLLVETLAAGMDARLHQPGPGESAWEIESA